MFIKKFNSFLNESLQLGNGNIIDEEDVESVFHDFIGNKKIHKIFIEYHEWTNPRHYASAEREEFVEFCIQFIITEPTNIRDYQKEIDDIKERMLDQFGYHLIEVVNFKYKDSDIGNGDLVTFWFGQKKYSKKEEPINRLTPRAPSVNPDVTTFYRTGIGRITRIQENWD